MGSSNKSGRAGDNNEEIKRIAKATGDKALAKRIKKNEDNDNTTNKWPN